MLGWARRLNLRARATRVPRQMLPQGVKYLPTYKTLHCVRTACAPRAWHFLILVLASIFVPTVLNKDETETETATGRVLVYMDTDHRGIGCSLLAWGGASPGRCAND